MVESRSKSTRVPSGDGDMLRVELGARLFAAVTAALDHALPSERVPRYDALRAIVGARVERAKAVGLRAAARDPAIGSPSPDVADPEVALRIEEVLRDGLDRFADAVERDPAMAWAARETSETLPQQWFTHGLPDRPS